MNKSLTIRLLSITILIIGLFISSCEEDEPVTPFIGYEYFPDDAGIWIEYEVDSIVYDSEFGNDSLHYFLREIIESKFVDNEGRDAQRIERYKRGNTSATWKIKDVWYANLTSTTAEKVEENVRFIKLNFPLKLDKKWDGNIQNVQTEQNYEITKLNEPYEVNGFAFDSTVTVTQVNFETLVSKDFVVEVYAKNVGLVYKKYISTVLEPADGSIKTGVEYEYVITDYGM